MIRYEGLEKKVRYEDLEEKVLNNYPSADLESLRRAYVFSARAHKDQVRQSGEPYLSHPLAVANILAKMRLDPACVSVGLLHDVVEDTLTPIEMIHDYFGEEVSHLVDGVTKISQIQFSSREQRQAENFRKLLLAMADDLRVILVKLADRLHNMRTLQYLAPNKRHHIAQETLDIYAPIAHRLGMANIREELEDLAFANLDQVAYLDLTAQIEKKKIDSREFIRDITARLMQQLKEQDIQAQIKSRTKHIYSTYQKMMRQKIPLDQVYDFIAIRVLVDTKNDCYSVLGLVHELWKPVPSRIKDFIVMPRSNMYQSLHTSLVGSNGQLFEVQIRTHDMHQIAEMGIAAHWNYKLGRRQNDDEVKRFTELRQALETYQEENDHHQFLSNLKIDLYSEEVYIFTPKGEVLALPRGATPVDFAYHIHTEVGNRCVGAKVSGRIVPLKYPLRNGEMVEITTSGEGRPSRDWLTFVRTSRARNAIRRWLNQRQKEEALELGRKLLEKESRRLGLSLKNLWSRLEGVIAEFKAPDVENLLISVGYGKIRARQIVRRLEPEKMPQQQPIDDIPFASTTPRKASSDSESTIRVKGYDDLLVFRARCCNPIQGESIVGYITLGRGISVHSRNCPNVENLLLNPERTLDVQWSDGVGETRYPVRISISTEDRPAMLADITSAVSELKTNIVDAQARTVDSRYGEIEITVEVRDMGHLNKILHFLKGISGVHSVDRTRSGSGR